MHAKQRSRVGGLLVWLGLCGAVAAAPLTNGVLRVHPINARYFTDNSGKAIYLTGVHTWASIEDGWLTNGRNTDPAPAFDYTGYLSYIVGQHQNFTRLWVNELPKVDFSAEFGSTAVYYPSPSPWQRTGPGTAGDGKPTFNLNALNQAYFDRLGARVAAARDSGVYVSVMLFEGYSTRVKTGALGWNFSPFHPTNNINGINGDPNGNGCGIEAHSLQVPAITAIQLAYVDKVIDTVNGYDNVVYEISNEEWNNASSGYSSIAWQTSIMDHIRAYEAGKPKQHPVVLTCIYNQAQNGGENALLTNSTAESIAPYGAGTLNDNPAATTGNKVIFADTDHIYGLGGGADWVWKVFTRGYNPIFMDSESSGWPLGESTTYNRSAASSAMGTSLRYAERMNVAAATPQNSLASTGYCLASAGSEYLVYQPQAGNVTIYGLPAGTYTYEWTRSDTGAFDSSGEITVSAGNRSFTPPFTPAVLFVRGVAANQVATPVMSPQGGSFSGSIGVTLTSATSGATIRYTLDGSEPDTGSTLYSGPLALTASVTLKAKAFKAGMSDSNTIGANFLAQTTAGAIIDDDFTDGNLGSNAGGTGTGWNAGSFNGAPLPTESGGSFNASMGTENGVGAIHGKDIFTFWDADGMTVTWVIKDMTVQTPHAFSCYLAYCAELGVISANRSNSGQTWNMSQVNTKGGFYISVGKKDNSNAVEMWVVVSSKNFSGVEGSSGFIRLPAQQGSVLGPRWTATFPLTVTATLTSNGWSVTAGGLATPIAGNWTSSLISGANNASITDEFRNGAFLFTAGRNHGIDGSGKTYTANSGRIERVTATRNAGTTVSSPSFSPGAGTYSSAQVVTISSSTGGASIRYTLDGSNPTSSSGTLYGGPVSIGGSATLKAIAYKSGMTDSGLTSGTYNIGGAAGPLSNGSFEDGTTGWTIESSGASAAAYGVSNAQGRTDGTNALALGTANAAGNAVFSQSVATTAGAQYVLAFDYGAFGSAGKAQQVLVEAVNGATVLTSAVVTAVGPGSFVPANTTFAARTLSFTAASGATLLRFTDQTSLANSSSCDGMLDRVSLSALAAAAAPSFSPVPGAYGSAQSVTISSGTAGASIRYTLDGSEPSGPSGLVYSGPVSIGSSATLKAIATKSGVADSTVTSGAYTIGGGGGSAEFVNGSFEHGTNGWTIATTDARAAAYGVLNSQGCADGSYALALGNDNGAGNAVFSQTLATTAGARYALTFDYGGFGLGGRTQQLLVEAVDGAAVLASAVVTAVGPGNFDPAKTTFKTYTNTFKATSPTTTVRFSDQTTQPNSSAVDGVLDHVRIGIIPPKGTLLKIFGHGFGEGA